MEVVSISDDFDSDDDKKPGKDTDKDKKMSG
jgi:hypothetical protein